MSLNPNDPVIQILKGVVDQFQKQVDEISQAMEMMMKGTGQAITKLQSRVAVLETKLNPPLRDTDGKEL